MWGEEMLKPNEEKDNNSKSEKEYNKVISEKSNSSLDKLIGAFNKFKTKKIKADEITADGQIEDKETQYSIKTNIAFKLNKERIMEISKNILNKFKTNYKGYLLLTGVTAFFIICLANIKSSDTVLVQNMTDITDNKAEEYFYNGDYDKAVNEYKLIMDKDSNKVKWQLKIAEVYSVQGDVYNSNKYVDEAKKDKIPDGDTQNFLVFTEFMNKNYKAALDDGTSGLKLYSSNKKLIKTMFTVYMANGQLNQAKKLIATYPKNDKSAYDVAEYSRMLMIVGEWDEGFKQLKYAWNIDKDEFKIYDVLAQVSDYNKNDLLESIGKLVSKNPSDFAYKMWLAKIYSRYEETADQANKLLNTIKSKDMGNIEIKLIEASTLQNLHQNDKADKLIEQVIKDNKNDYRVLHTAGWYYLNKKDLDKAEMYCKESIKKNKDYPDNYGFLMPEILKARGKSLGGEPFFRTAMFKEPYNYNIMLNIADFYWNTSKNTDKALEYFQFAELVKPDDPEIKYNMALININNKKDEEAIKILKQCIKLSDSIPKYHRTLGAIYMAKGNNPEAIKEIRAAYSEDETDVLTLNNAGCYYIMVDGNLDRGMYNLQKAYDGLNKLHDKYSTDIIKDNYNKAKKLIDQYKSASSSGKLKVPNFVVLYY